MLWMESRQRSNNLDPAPSECDKPHKTEERSLKVIRNEFHGLCSKWVQVDSSGFKCVQCFKLSTMCSVVWKREEGINKRNGR